MEPSRRQWGQRVVILCVAGAVAWALMAAPASARFGITRPQVKKIARVVATKVFNEKSPTLRDGCPVGTVRSADGCMERTTRGQASWANANKTCGNLGRRLPTAGELVAAFSTPGITPATEITSNIYINSETLTQIMAVVTASSSVGGQADLTTVASYRCVAPLSNV